jgi:hypothetical protein
MMVIVLKNYLKRQMEKRGNYSAPIVGKTRIGVKNPHRAVGRRRGDGKGR